MLLADESGLMALGSTFTAFGPGGEYPRTWHSTDGQSWQMGTGQFLDYSPSGQSAHGPDRRRRPPAGLSRRRRDLGIGRRRGLLAPCHRVRVRQRRSRPAERLISTGAASSIESVNALLFLEGSVFAFGKDGVWSRSEDIGGGTCNADPGDGSLGQCRSDAAVWIGTFDG